MTLKECQKGETLEFCSKLSLHHKNATFSQREVYNQKLRLDPKLLSGIEVAHFQNYPETSNDDKMPVIIT